MDLEQARLEIKRLCEEARAANEQLEELKEQHASLQMRQQVQGLPMGSYMTMACEF